MLLQLVTIPILGKIITAKKKNGSLRPLNPSNRSRPLLRRTGVPDSGTHDVDDIKLLIVSFSDNKCTFDTIGV